MNQQKLWRKTRLNECHANSFANGRMGAIYVISFMMLAPFSLASCSSYDSEQDKPFTVCPEEQIKFFACETSGETRGATATIDTLFTEDDIEWFNVSTREIRFKKQDEQLFNKLMKNYHKEGLEFRTSCSRSAVLCPTSTAAFSTTLFCTIPRLARTRVIHVTTCTTATQHSSSTTSARRPTLRRMPSSGKPSPSILRAKAN